jgi:tripartite-type tricarboxylate transporter receptor subunit TctC
MTDAVRAAVATADVAARIQAVGFEVVNSTTAEFEQVLQDELRLIPRLIREAGVTAE